MLLDDVKARLYKPKDGPANYQFLIDAFKKDPKKQKPKTEQKDSTQKAPMALAINLVSIKNIELTFNDTNQVSLESAKYEDTWLSKPSGKLKNLKGQWGWAPSPPRSPSAPSSIRVRKPSITSTSIRCTSPPTTISPERITIVRSEASSMSITSTSPPRWISPSISTRKTPSMPS